ncbi:MAG TPA: NUDIX domain-containing protein [Puia sp.]|nr:NUDIX domain-containing protein [Puia sp.]
MARQSAGILLYRFSEQHELQVLLVHPGGPFWRNKDVSAWSIPKGEPEEGEALMAAAVREFLEETGSELNGNFIQLKAVQQKNGKTVSAWAVEGDLDADNIRSNYFEMEWPPGSKKKQSFPEIDRAAWFSLSDAATRINPAQVSFLHELAGLQTGK